MINAREFCREPGYPITVVLTYAFDPLFFERIPLDDFRVGGSRRVVVVADAGQVAEAMERCAGQIYYLGRDYSLAESNAANTFHPKLIARLAPAGGRVWIGSGNLTFTGWGGNHELAAAWSVGPGTDDSGAWLNDVFEAVGSITKSANFRSQLDALRSSITWLTRSPTTPERSPVLLGLPSRPLAPQLAQRWSNRRFDELKIYTGSTDIEGAFLLWAHRTFGVQRAVICVNPAFASFDPAKLDRLPLNVHFVAAEPGRLMHAKFFWFSGPNGNAAVMGSANCSAAAWLADHGSGNAELVTVYDDAELGAFEPLLARFDNERVASADFLNVPPTQGPEDEDEHGEGIAYRIVSLRLRATGRLIEVKLEPGPADGNGIYLVVDAVSLRLMLTPRGDAFVGRLGADQSIGVGTVFGHVEVVSGNDRYVTRPRWVDNEPALEGAARERKVDSNLEDLARNGFGGSSHQRILETIYSVSADLLSQEEPDFSALSDRLERTQRPDEKDEKDDASVRPVDPASILFSLKELRASRRSAPEDRAKFEGVSLQGVIGMLFSTEKRSDIDLSKEKWEAEDADADFNAGKDPDSAPKTLQRDEPSDAAAAAAALKAFRNQIEYFLFEFAKQGFADTCSAAKLMHAASFPPLLCVKGREAGWLPDGILPAIATRVVDTLLSKSYSTGKPRGLLRQVEARYRAAGHHDEFLQTVGEGALWAVLLASLAQMENESIAGLVRQSAAIATVLACSELVAASNADQLSIYVRSLIIRDAEFAVTERAIELSNALKDLVELLAKSWDEIYRDQGSGRALQAGGSVMWSRKWGWEILPRSPAQSYCGDAINLELAAKQRTDIRLAIGRLQDAARLSPEDQRAC
jgi:hypothetical protein